MPAIKIHIPTPLRQYTGNLKEVPVSAVTLGEALSALTTDHGALRQHLFNDMGKVRSFVNIYVNDEDMRYLDKENTVLNEGDSVSIVPSIAGGAL